MTTPFNTAPGSGTSPGDRTLSGPAGQAVPTGRGDLPGTGTGTEPIPVGSYADYSAAQHAVDYLSDQRFPVEHTSIVGTDLRLVENVLGRLTTGRAALAGAASGAWFGLLIGLLVGLFSASSWWGVLIASVLIGALWGAVFGSIAHAMTGGRRDFTSRSSLQAGQYVVMADPDYAAQARQLLTRLHWQQSGAS